MEFLEEHWNELLGILIAVAGFVGLVRGGLIAGSGDLDDEYRMVEGLPARLLSIGYIAVGSAFFLSWPILGILMAVVLLALTRALGKPVE